MRKTRLLGIDPGLHVTGYGAVDRLSNGRCRLVEAGAVRTSPTADLATRLQVLYEGICEALDDLEPEVVIVESLYSKYRHPRTAILMGHARGVIYLAAQQRGLPVEAYPASQVKRALTGVGRAAKRQVAEMVCRLLGLPEAPRPHDVTDALALALCHASPQRFAGERGLPAAVRESVGSAGVSSVLPHPLTPSPGGGEGAAQEPFSAVDASSASAGSLLATRGSPLATRRRSREVAP